MDGLEIFTLSEVNQREKDKCHIKSLICGVLKKKIEKKKRKKIEKKINKKKRK